MKTKNLKVETSTKKQKRRCRKKMDKCRDFGKIGGLSHHIKTLKELVIFPLLHGHVYEHFNIKAPRGVLFYGPPGTGKTLVAGALAHEMNKGGAGKVNFFHRKGADVLDKWVGESEKKLRDLFATASKATPSIIFFDEIDALAPIRSHRNEHVHSSVVSTLLALMDGLDETDGVVVLGATNRLDAIDPALRRPGRFDKELYFPMPCARSRREILEVHTKGWKQRPSSEVLDRLAELTAGYSGSDLQALCADAVICCAKRVYPDLEGCAGDRNIEIDLDKIKVDECDFLTAKINASPVSRRFGAKTRRPSAIVMPLLKAQLQEVVSRVEAIWPHFLQTDYRYVSDDGRYAGRMVLFGSGRQGLSTHIVPAILQVLEHLPNEVLDVSTVFETDIANLKKQIPSVLVLLRVDEWWDHIGESNRIAIAGALEDIHAGLPILTIATCRKNLPKELHEFFFNNCSVAVNIGDPTEDERKEFFSPLFFDENKPSFCSVLMNCRASKNGKKNDNVVPKSKPRCLMNRLRGGGIGLKQCKFFGKREQRDKLDDGEFKDAEDIKQEEKPSEFSLKSNVVNCCVQSCVCDRLIKKEKCEILDRKKTVCAEKIFRDSNDTDKKKIFDLWFRISTKTSKNMPLTHLEILYDAIILCISMNKNNFPDLIENTEDTLNRIENVKNCQNYSSKIA